MTLEELQAELLKQQDEQKRLNAENESMKKQLEEKTKREKELEEHNQKLWLKVTSKVENESKDEKEEIPSFLDEKTYKLLDKNDQKLLREILEEE